MFEMTKSNLQSTMPRLIQYMKWNDFYRKADELAYCIP